MVNPNDPMSPANVARAEQMLVFAAETMPPTWYRAYAKAVAAGFTASQALVLIQTWILSTGTALVVIIPVAGVFGGPDVKDSDAEAGEA